MRDDPAPPDDAPPRRFPAAWWLAMAASTVLIGAGAAVGFLGPRLFPAPRNAAPSSAAGAAVLATAPAPAK